MTPKTRRPEHNGTKISSSCHSLLAPASLDPRLEELRFQPPEKVFKVWTRTCCQKKKKKKVPSSADSSGFSSGHDGEDEGALVRPEWGEHAVMVGTQCCTPSVDGTVCVCPGNILHITASVSCSSKQDQVASTRQANHSSHRDDVLPFYFFAFSHCSQILQGSVWTHSTSLARSLSHTHTHAQTPTHADTHTPSKKYWRLKRWETELLLKYKTNTLLLFREK